MNMSLVALLMVVSVVIAAQNPNQPPQSQRRLAQRPPVNNQPFNAHDLAGIWTRGGDDGGSGCITSLGPCGDRGFGTVRDWPSLTAEGERRLKANIPSHGRMLGTPDATAHPDEHWGRLRAVQPAISNDPQPGCNPQGVTRMVMFPYPTEFLVLPDRIVQHFQWHNKIRTIWMDGRKLPTPEEVDTPRWWGYSVGRWEGNMLVVDTVGQDERVWLDHFGYPISDVAQLQERYKRVSYDVLELSMTLTDPKLYTKPWVSELKRFRKLPLHFYKAIDWPGLLDEDCAPLDEVDVFNSKIVNPAVAPR
jgi:hypothetical protein